MRPGGPCAHPRGSASRLSAPVLLRAPESAHRRSLEAPGDTEVPDGAEAPDGAGHGILDENPDLADYYRESPEAALDLLRLIREATKER